MRRNVVDIVEASARKERGTTSCFNDSSATAQMTQNHAVLEAYAPAPTGEKVECVGGTFLWWQNMDDLVSKKTKEMAIS